jgi:hypothetical protein
MSKKERSLVEVAGFSSFLCLFIEAQDFVNDFHIGKQHSPATVPFDA